MSAPEGISFVTGVFPAEDGEPDTYVGRIHDLPSAPFSAFGPMRTSRLRAGGGEVELAIVPGELGEPDSVIAGWVASAAETVASYYGELPMRRALVIEEVWRDFAKGLPKGLPEPGDRGLDFTPTWGRTYWGGALFCLLADVAIRERTNGKKSLDDGLRAIVGSGGSLAVSWSLERALDRIDSATGLSVLRELHAKMGSSPSPVDVEALMDRLGVRVRGREVTFDDSAKLAWIRRAITSPSAR